ncbi:MAG TPA: glutamyl-tRNA reductase [Alphaproteobacteria bacterium]|nr:glutamyl-tRNA reductase [Alphaproteobacteria bacterium]
MPGELTSSHSEPGGLFVVGADHRGCPASLRERLFIAEAALPDLLASLREAGLTQAVALSTCDRSVIIGWHGDPADAAARGARRLERLGGFAEGELASFLTIRQDAAAAEYLFAVAASLESAIVGEPQVLGQLRDAYRAAMVAGMVGGELDRACQGAFAAAKRVRSETAIGARAVSIATAALQVAREVHGNLARCSALFVGAGELGELVAEKLRDAGVARFLVADSLGARAEATAKRLGGHVYALADLESAMAEADIVLCALGRGAVIVTPEMTRAALRRRRQRPIFLIDAAVPGDIAPAVNGVEEAFLYSLDDLENVAQQGLAARVEAAEKAWAILREALAAFAVAGAAREAVPAIAGLRAHFEATRARLLAEQPHLTAEEATRLLVNRLLHAPSEALRALASEGQSFDALLNRLFGLDDRS